MHSIDRLSGLFRFDSCVLLHFQISEPWRIRVPKVQACLLYACLAGALEITIGEHRHRLTQGKVLILPHGQWHEMMGGNYSSQKAKCISEIFEAEGINGCDKDGFCRLEHLKIGVEGPRTTFLLGAIHFERYERNPLITALPTALRIPAGVDGADQMVTATLATMSLELQRGRDSSGLIISKLADLLFTDAVRSCLFDKSASLGSAHAVVNVHVARAFAAIHGNPQRAWTLKQLAREAGCSRTMLSLLFRDFVGMGAVEYLTDWRMHVASRLLLQEKSKVAAVAELVGYKPEAFAVAFKRWSGLSPRVFRSQTQRRDKSKLCDNSLTQTSIVTPCVQQK